MLKLYYDALKIRLTATISTVSVHISALHSLLSIYSC